MKEQVSFESLNQTVVCLRLQQTDESESLDSVKCTIYAAEDYPSFTQGGFDAHYNLINIEGNAVEDFKDAFILAEVNSFILRNPGQKIELHELMYSVTFPEKMFMLSNEFKDMFEIISSICTRALVNFYNNLEIDNSAEKIEVSQQPAW